MNMSLPPPIVRVIILTTISASSSTSAAAVITAYSVSTVLDMILEPASLVVGGVSPTVGVQSGHASKT